jgi:hypothetical protein
LDDGEPIEQVGFESDNKSDDAADEKKSLKQDPPSLEKLVPPANGAKPINKPDAAKSAEALREEIRRLEARLKELEKK